VTRETLDYAVGSVARRCARCAMTWSRRADLFAIL